MDVRSCLSDRNTNFVNRLDRCPMRSLVALIVVLASGCGTTSAGPDAASAQDVPATQIVAPCPDILAATSHESRMDYVFLRLLRVPAADVRAPLKQSLEHPVHVFEGAGIYAQSESTVQGIWEGEAGGLTVTSHLPAQANEPLRFELRIRDQAWDVHAFNQEPILLSRERAEQSAIIVIPYLLRNREDMRFLLECHAREGRQ